MKLQQHYNNITILMIRDFAQYWRLNERWDLSIKYQVPYGGSCSRGHDLGCWKGWPIPAHLDTSTNKAAYFQATHKNNKYFSTAQAT